MTEVVSPGEFDASPRHARDRLLLVTNDGMRARRRPRALLVMYAWQALAGLAIAWPASSWVRESYGHHPRGDGPIFDADGLALADLVMRGDGVGVVVTHTAVIAAACFVLGLLPLAALVVSIGHATLDRAAPPLRAAFERAAESFGTLLRLLALYGLAQLALVGVGLVVGAAASNALGGRLDDAGADLAGAFVIALFVLAAAYVGVAHDVARCAAIRFRTGALDSMMRARAAMRPSPGGVTWSWAWRALAGIAAATIAAVVAQRLGGRPGWPLLALAVLHQAVVLARTALRASWLGRALRLVDRS